MRKWMGLALTICLLLSGCGGEKTEQPPAEEAPVQETEPQKETTSEKETEPAGDWREAYIGFLEELCQKEKELRDTERPDYDPDAAYLALAEVSGMYVLYDIDKDTVPELLIRYGSCEADYHTTAYGYRNGGVVELGDIPTGHTSLYTWPEENGMAWDWGHMGGHFIDKITLENDTLVQTRFFEEGGETPVGEYTPVEELVPGSRLLWEVRTMVQLPETAPLTLPIEDYGSVPLHEEMDPGRDETSRNAIMNVLEKGGTFYAVTADGFGGDAGETTLKDYLQPGGITEYGDAPLTVTGRVWLDLDQDGTSECLLRAERAPGDPYGGVCLVALSEQAGIVYGYCLNYMDSSEVHEDGVFRDIWAEGASWGEMRLSFRGVQCYEYTAPENSTVPAVAWEEP